MKKEANSMRPRANAALIGIAVASILGWSASAPAATWTQVTTLAPSNAGTMMLLTDGTVMVQGNPMDQWMRLTPSVKGSYVDGTWSPLAPMSTPRLYFASHVLPNGKVWILGGEYSGPTLQPTWTNTGEIYDPVSNSWSPIASHPQANFGDDPSMLLPDGKILAGSLTTNMTYRYDIATNSWSFAASKVYPDRSDEETWVKLPNGKVLTYDIFQSVDHAGQYAETYDPTTNTWSSVSPSDSSALGSIPALSSVALGYELGPALIVRGNGANGRAFVVGATGHTALYSPATNTWAPGPDVMGTLGGNPALFGGADSPAAMVPSGHVIFAADASPTLGTFKPPTKLFDFDPLAGTISEVSPGIPDTNLATLPAYVTRMLVLPTGEVLFADGSRRLWIYTPDGAPQPSWRPVFSNLTYKGGGVFTVQGVRMNGPSSGSSYGDDVESDQNYPIVSLTDASGNVFYGRTTSWSKTGVGTTVANETVELKMKPGMPPGDYSLVVTGAGVSSKPKCVRITAGQIQGTAAGSNAAITCGGPQ